jgi:hypothetical protein
MVDRVLLTVASSFVKKKNNKKPPKNSIIEFSKKSHKLLIRNMLDFLPNLIEG